jgi:hypothetical protein
MYVDTFTLQSLMMIISIAAIIYLSRDKKPFNLKDLAKYVDQHH